MTLLDTIPSFFQEYDLKKLKGLALETKLALFYKLEKYPDTTWFYHNVIGHEVIEEKGMPMEDKLKFLKHLCYYDLYYFAKYILKKTLLCEQPNRGMAEKLMIRYRPDEQEWKILCEPRGTYKTTLGSISYPVWRIMQNRNISLLIDSETDIQSKDIYLACKEEMENNFLLKEIWGNFVSPRWNENKLFVEGRTISRRDPSLTHSGTEVSINGIHPNEIICDDPCSEVNTQNVTQRDKTDDHCKLFTPLLMPKGQVIYIMTRWAMDDQAGRMIKRMKDTFSIISVKSCYGENGEGKSSADGLYAPTILDNAFLERARKNMGMYRFSANYMNNPEPDTDKAFSMDWLRTYEGARPVIVNEAGNEIEIPLTVFIGLDASWADKTSNTGRDPSAFVVGGFNADGDFYLLEYINKRITPDEVIDTLFNLVNTYHPAEVVSEDIGTQKGINKQIDDEMDKRKRYFTLNRVKHQAQSKGSRIMGLQPLFKNGNIIVPEEGMEDFLEQYASFSPGAQIAHDDILDALEMIMSEYREVYAVPDKTENEFIEETFDIFDPISGRMGWR